MIISGFHPINILFSLWGRSLYRKNQMKNQDLYKDPILKRSKGREYMTCMRIPKQIIPTFLKPQSNGHSYNANVQFRETCTFRLSKTKLFIPPKCSPPELQSHQYSIQNPFMALYCHCIKFKLLSVLWLSSNRSALQTQLS